MDKKKRYCKYPDCSHSSVENVGCKLQLLPADHSKCRVWMRLCKFAGTPRLLPARIQICSCQLVDKNGPTKDNPNPLPYEVSMKMVCSRCRKGGRWRQSGARYERAAVWQFEVGALAARGARVSRRAIAAQRPYDSV